MQLTKKEKTIKYVICGLLIVVFALIQNVGGLFFEIGRARCFFLIPVSVLLAVGEDEKEGALLGLFAGILWDTVSLQHMGFNAVYLMFVCYIICALVNFVFRNTFVVGTVSAVIATFLYCVFYWLFFVLSRGGEGSALSFFKFYLPCFIYTALLTPVIAFVFYKLKARLNKEETVE